MFHYTIGHIGHLAVIIAFVSAVYASIAYFFTVRSEALDAKSTWRILARVGFMVHAVAVFTVIITLFTIIYNHYYEYHYAWSHSSNNLPVEFMISCFWEGQEGSFLLWIFWHVLIGLVIMRFHSRWEAPVLAVFMAVQAFLTSMILGVILGEIKIGSSPFILLRDFMTDAPIFKSNPEFIPEDGTGLNPLLQNYWMVIHPPTLFLGFALTLVPFSFCISGLWLKRFEDWVRVALPWGHVATAVLGVGILMGGYWAYETLNFGGYWNWDPVENAVYVPWLVLVAAIHMMIVYKNNSSALRSASVLVIATFILILYSTFLTRSGILGNASVHSFTDLGLSGQLLLYLIFFTLMSIGLLIWRWNILPGKKHELHYLTREFWIFLGGLTLCMAAFQVIFTTSIPVYNALLKSIGMDSNIALPADQVAHYSKFQIWFSIGIALLSGTGQYFFWQKADHKKLIQALTIPASIALLLASSIVLLASVQRLDYILLLTAGLYTICSNVAILFQLMFKSPKLIGGSVAHIGLGLMLIGILFSAGYSKIISKNTSGLLYSKSFTEEMNLDNVLLFRYDSVKMGGYTLLYKGPRVQPFGSGTFINKEILLGTEVPYKATLEKPAIEKGDTLYKAGDTVRYMHENTFFEVQFWKEGALRFTLYPRAQINKEMGLLASPDIKKLGMADLYAHVSSIPDPEEEEKWGSPNPVSIAIGDTFLINDYWAVFEKIQKVEKVQGIPLASGDAAVQATVRVLTKTADYHLEPVFLIHNNMVGRLPDINRGLGIRLALTNIDVQKGVFEFVWQSGQRDWIILKAMEKPFIDLLWLGSLMVTAGFAIAIRRRFSNEQNRNARN